MTPIDVVLEAAAFACGTTPREMRGRDRRAIIVKRRAFCARMMRAEGYSYPAIGKALRRDHTTIMHLLGAV